MLIIVTEFKGGIFFVRLKGKLNNKTKYVLRNKVTNLVELHGITSLVINVSELNFIDLDGLAELFNNYCIVNRYKGNTYICGINESINITLKQSSILDYIKEINDELNAMRVIKWME